MSTDDLDPTALSLVFGRVFAAWQDSSGARSALPDAPVVAERESVPALVRRGARRVITGVDAERRRTCPPGSDLMAPEPSRKAS